MTNKTILIIGSIAVFFTFLICGATAVIVTCNRSAVESDAEFERKLAKTDQFIAETSDYVERAKAHYANKKQTTQWDRMLQLVQSVNPDHTEAQYRRGHPELYEIMTKEIYDGSDESEIRLKVYLQRMLKETKQRLGIIE